jgi:nucleotide-binding universal stress UspA family protein
MFTRILLGLDASPSGEVAVDFATALARGCGAAVHVLFVNEKLVGGRGATILSPAEARDLVGSAVEQLRGAGLVADGSIASGTYRDVASRLATTAADTACDAIVLGSFRRRGLIRLFSPRVREKTMRLTHLPVLAAPSPLRVTKAPEAIALTQVVAVGPGDDYATASPPTARRRG